jgi:hypothetical protein
MNVVRQHGRAAWVVPSYKNGRGLWRWAQSIASPMRRYFDISKAERTISTHRGGFFGIYSADNADAIRGEWFHLVVIDEAARVSEEDWTDAIQPTLADADGDAILISTPKGHNWFWREWHRGSTDDGSAQQSWCAPTSANPNPRIRKAAELARTRVPDRTYRQEWLAQFLDDAGGVFRNVRSVATARPQPPLDGAQYVYGVDWGRQVDYTAISIWDATTQTEVLLDRFNTVEYKQQQGRLLAHARTYPPQVIVAEQNSIGVPIIEDLIRLDLPVQPFVTSNATKAQIVDDLALALEQRTITLLDDAIGMAELEAFEAQRLPSGLVRYSAPEGCHDDTVMARCLAYYGAKSSGSLLLWDIADDDDE